MYNNNAIDCDVLVVGGGVAAVSAAVAAIEAGAQVSLAVKGTFGSVGLRGSGASSCGTTFLGGPYLPGLTPGRYDPDRQFQKIIAAGLGTADRRLARILVEQAEAAGQKVVEWGVKTGMKGPVSLGYPFVAALEQRIRAHPISKYCKLHVQGCIGKSKCRSRCGEGGHGGNCRGEQRLREICQRRCTGVAVPVIVRN